MGNIKQKISQYFYPNVGQEQNAGGEKELTPKQISSINKLNIKRQKRDLKSIGHDHRYVDAIYDNVGDRTIFSTSRHDLDSLKEFLNITLIDQHGNKPNPTFANIVYNPKIKLDINLNSNLNINTEDEKKEFTITIAGEEMDRTREEVDLYLLLDCNLHAIAEKKNLPSGGSDAESSDNWISKTPMQQRPRTLLINQINPDALQADWADHNTEENYFPKKKSAQQPRVDTPSGGQPQVASKSEPAAYPRTRQQVPEIAHYARDKVVMTEVGQQWRHTHQKKQVSTKNGNAWLRTAWLAALQQSSPQELGATLTGMLEGRRGASYIPTVVELARKLQQEGSEYSNHKDFETLFNAVEESALANLTFEVINHKNKADYKTAKNRSRTLGESELTMEAMTRKRNEEREALHSAITQNGVSGNKTYVATLFEVLGLDLVVAEKRFGMLDQIDVFAQPGSILAGLDMRAGRHVNTRTLDEALRSKPVIFWDDEGLSIQMPRNPDRSVNRTRDMAKAQMSAVPPASITADPLSGKSTSPCTPPALNDNPLGKQLFESIDLNASTTHTQTFGIETINFREFNVSNMKHHSLVNMSNAGNKCWMRAMWFSAFDQFNLADAPAIEANLRTLLAKRLQMKTEDYMLEAQKPERSKILYSPPIGEQMSAEQEARENFARQTEKGETQNSNLEDAIDNVIDMIAAFKIRPGQGSESTLAVPFRFSKIEEDRLKILTYAILKEKANDLPEFNITASVLGDQLGDADAIRVLLTALELKTYILKIPDDSDNLKDIRQPDVSSVESTDTNLPSLLVQSTIEEYEFECNKSGMIDSEANAKGIKNLYLRGNTLIVFEPGHFQVYKSE